MSESKEIVDLINDLFEDSKYFLNEAKKRSSNDAIQKRCNRAVVLFAWAAFEGWINKSCLDFANSMSNLSIHEKSFLTEKKVELKNGKFSLSNRDNYESTENKIEFLMTTIANQSLNKSTKQWQDFQEVKKYRDSLVHPKLGRANAIDIDKAEKSLKTLVHFLNLLSQKLYRKNFKI